jgi:hypothetical protein
MMPDTSYNSFSREFHRIYDSSNYNAGRYLLVVVWPRHSPQLKEKLVKGATEVLWPTNVVSNDILELALSLENIVWRMVISDKRRVQLREVWPTIIIFNWIKDSFITKNIVKLPREITVRRIERNRAKLAEGTNHRLAVGLTQGGGGELYEASRSANPTTLMRDSTQRKWTT